MPETETDNTSQVNTDTGDVPATIQDAIGFLMPLAEFHKAVEGATADDLRMHWDVRVLRGKNSPFAQVAGTSSLPQILARKRVACAPSAIQEEVSEKISKPLLVAIQGELDRLDAAEQAADAEDDGDGDVADTDAGETEHDS